MVHCSSKSGAGEKGQWRFTVQVLGIKLELLINPLAVFSCTHRRIHQLLVGKKKKAGRKAGKLLWMKFHCKLACMLQLLILLSLAALSCASIFSCPESDSCTACNPSCPYICVTIPPGNHDPDLTDSVQLYQHHYKGFTEATTLQYRIVFHNSTLSYGCDTWCSNVNKLFGFSRGMVQVMDKSCIFGWRKGLQANDTGKIAIFGYGWYNASMPPWETPGQMPYMIALQVEQYAQYGKHDF